MNEIQTIKSIYEAFGRGDVPAILAYLTEAVEWDADASDIGVPWLAPRRGKGNVPGFFQSMSAIEIRRFEPKSLLAGDGIVVAVIALEFVVKSTGHVVREDDEVHIWRFDGNGKVKSFRHKVDSHQHWLALQPA